MKKNIEVYSDMQAQMDFQNEIELGNYVDCASCGTVFYGNGDYYMVTDKTELDLTICLNLRTGELKGFGDNYLIYPLATTLVILGFAEDGTPDKER